MPCKDIESARASRLKHYRANKQQYIDRKNKVKQEMKDWVNEVKSVPCMDCGQSYPSYVMDLDHRDPSEKVEEISRAVSRGSWKKLREEVAKCDVVCSNCHRERTYGDVA